MTPATELDALGLTRVERTEARHLRTLSIVAGVAVANKRAVLWIRHAPSQKARERRRLAAKSIGLPL